MEMAEVEMLLSQFTVSYWHDWQSLAQILASQTETWKARLDPNSLILCLSQEPAFFLFRVHVMVWLMLRGFMIDVQ